MAELFANKQLFTYVIISLYAMNFAYQFIWTKDYVWGLYWLCAAGITVASMTLSNRV